MPWQERSRMESRREFVRLAQSGTVSMTELCRRSGIARSTGYRLLARMATEGEAGLIDRSRRPQTSPAQTPDDVAAAVVVLRDAHPTWGGRKLHHALKRQGHPRVPAASTITDILRRAGRLGEGPAGPSPWRSFEADAPNDLVQLDGLGHRPYQQGRVQPITLLDDHSRYGLALVASADLRLVTVQQVLTEAFRTYGLPRQLLCDNGPPWGTSGNGGITALEVWLIRLGITVLHGHPYHPQTQGKIERWHRTIAADVFGPTLPLYPDLAAVQRAFDAFREAYNHDRPHQGLAFAVPASRYAPSPRPFPETLPELVYGPDDVVRRVRGQGSVSYQHRSLFVSRGLIGQNVGLRPTTTDGIIEIRYGHVVLTTWDLRQKPPGEA